MTTIKRRVALIEEAEGNFIVYPVGAGWTTFVLFAGPPANARATTKWRATMFQNVEAALAQAGRLSADAHLEFERFSNGRRFGGVGCEMYSLEVRVSPKPVWAWNVNIPAATLDLPLCDALQQLGWQRATGDGGVLRPLARRSYTLRHVLFMDYNQICGVVYMGPKRVEQLRQLLVSLGISEL